MSRTWSKTYPTPAAAETAAHHHAWISGVGLLPIPDLLRRVGDTLVFARMPGRHATPADLTTVARALAPFHVAAHRHLADGGLPACTCRQFTAWTEMHHILTSPYLGRNGYRFTWSHPLSL